MIYTNPDGTVVYVEVGEGTKIGKNVTIEESVEIGKNVTICDGVYIGECAVIEDNTVIGADALISSYSHLLEGSAIRRGECVDYDDTIPDEDQFDDEEE
jgi:UDP-3-O-[3-hydroxymyristoyl] glucosamine N-acyltransferase